MKKAPALWRSWFVVDKRTNSIRVYTQPHLALSNPDGKGVKPGHVLVARDYKKDDKSQVWNFNEKRIQNKSSKRCLSMQNEKNKDENNLVLW